tara:strand:- start:350 stop:565 length:216 start_codon:yes stop_codon:yes gene_type:complete
MCFAQDVLHIPSLLLSTNTNDLTRKAVVGRTVVSWAAVRRDVVRRAVVRMDVVRRAVVRMNVVDNSFKLSR